MIGGATGMAANELSKGARMALGAVLALAGIACLVSGVMDLSGGMPFSDDRWLKLPLGFVVGCTGINFAVPEEALRTRAVRGALVATGLALSFDWIAFGPGERRVTGGAAASGAAVHTPVSSGVGRFAFGIGALLLDAAAAWFWIYAFRMKRRRG